MQMSRAKQQECLLVAKHVKPAARLVIASSHIKQATAYITSLGLSYAFSSLHVYASCDHRLGYSNKGVVSAPNEHTSVLMYIARTSELAHQVCVAEQQHNERMVGTLLGYPACCIDFFIRCAHRKHSDNDYVEPMIIASDHSNLDETTYDWHTNIFARYGDYPLLSHFPCSLSCKASMSLGAKYFRVICEHDQHWAEQLKLFLQRWVIHTEQGVFFLSSAVCDEHRNVSFADVVATSDNAVFKHLYDDHHCAISGPDTLTVKVPLKGWMLRFS